jgi:hypothetical protein
LITGVVTMPPSGPRLVMVMVEPDSSSRAGLAAARGFRQARDLASRWSTGPRLGVRSTGTIRPASVCAATPRCTAS